MNLSPNEHRVSSTAIVLVAMAALVATFANTASASGPDGQVRGFATEYLTGSPVAGAEIGIEASDFPWVFQTTTDPGGHYSIAVPPHRYTLSVSTPIHVRDQYSIAVGSGETTWRNLTLTPVGGRTAWIQGYLTDGVSGFPVTAGTIVAGPPSWTGGDRNTSSLNATGYYEIAISPGSYEVSTEGVFGYDPYSYYPVSASGGRATWYNFTLNPNPVNVWINGTVRDSITSAAIPGARVFVRVDTLQFPDATSDANGSYSVQVQSGNAEISADAVGYVPASTSTYVWGPGTYYEDLYLDPLSLSIRGYVRDGVTKAALPGVRVTLSPLFFTGYYDQTTTDAVGYYQFAAPDDDFVVAASVAGYAPWSTWVLSFGGPIVWANGTLWPIISTVSGYLIDGLDGTRIPGLLVSVLDLRSGYVASATSDATGLYTVTTTVSPAIVVDVYAQGPYAGNIAYVGTRPYQTTWVNLTLARLSAQILVNVTDAVTGLPISGANVIAGWFYGSYGALTNASGQVRIDAPAGAVVYLTALASGYLIWTGPMTTVVGANWVPIRLYPDLPKDVRIRGYVNDSSGAAIWGATVHATGYDGVDEYDYTDSTGYYEIWTVGQPQTVRATEYGYAAAQATVAPAPGDTIWVNLTLPTDSTPPNIRSFTANPSTGVDITTPAALLGDVGESNLERATISILMLQSVSAGVGTYLNLGLIDPANVSVANPSPGNYTVASSWDTRTPVARLSDGSASAWWTMTPVVPFLGVVPGYWDNGSGPVPGGAVFDVRNGRLLFVTTGYALIDPRDEPASTFAPYAFGLRVNMATAQILSSVLVNGPAFRLGTLGMALSRTVPGGSYAALLETWDSAGQYDAAVAMMQTGPDTTPPAANAGPDQSVDEDTTVTFDGSASTDNVGIVSYMWTFNDGGPQVLTGAIVTHIFSTPGTYVVTLTVTDGAGNSDTDTMTVTVYDVTSPTVSISAPSEGATVSGAVSVSAVAADNVGVVRVEFLVDGVSAGNDTAAPFGITLASGSLSLGNHTIEVVAFDAAGNSASDVRHVRVVSSPPGGGPGASPPLLLIGIILVVTLAMIAAAAILLRKRKPRYPMTAPTYPQAPISPPAPPSGSEQAAELDTGGIQEFERESR